MSVNTIFSKRFAELMKENKDTQVQIARDLHISQQAVSGWKTGKYVPDKDSLIAISDRYHVPVDYLLAEDETKAEREKQKMYLYQNFVINYIIRTCLDAFTANPQYEVSVSFRAYWGFSMRFPDGCDSYDNNNCIVCFNFGNEKYTIDGNFFDFLKFIIREEIEDNTVKIVSENERTEETNF